VKSYGTVQEVGRVLREEYGEYKPGVRRRAYRSHRTAVPYARISAPLSAIEEVVNRTLITPSAPSASASIMRVLRLIAGVGHQLGIPFQLAASEVSETLGDVAADVASADRVPADEAKRLDHFLPGDRLGVGELHTGPIRRAGT